jgi:hypothetical protein
MNFLNLNEVKECLSALNRVQDNLFADNFESLKINNFKIEFRAGQHSFCYPRQKLKCIIDYESIQISISDYNEAGIISMIRPLKDNRLSYFSWANCFSFKTNRQLVQASYIGCNIPISTACQIVKDLYKVSQLKTFF